MLKHMFLCAAVLVAAAGGAYCAHAAESPEGATAAVAQELKQVAELTGAATSPARLRGIVDWLASNFGLPAIHEPVQVAFVPAHQLPGLRYRALLQGGKATGAQPALSANVVAFYNDDTRTIFLSDDWTGRTPAEQSVLVHEMVHHLQNVGKVKYECPAAREKPAYLAQDQWLKQFGQELETEFEVDMLTIVVRSACMG